MSEITTESVQDRLAKLDSAATERVAWIIEQIADAGHTVNLIAFGGAATMGPSLGMVESSQPKNVKRDMWGELETAGDGHIVLEA